VYHLYLWLRMHKLCKRKCCIAGQTLYLHLNSHFNLVSKLYCSANIQQMTDTSHILPGTNNDLFYSFVQVPFVLLSYCHTVMLSYCQSYCHTVLLSYCMSHCLTVFTVILSPSYCHIVCLTVIPSHCLTAIPSHCLTVILSHCLTVFTVILSPVLLPYCLSYRHTIIPSHCVLPSSPSYCHLSYCDTVCLTVFTVILSPVLLWHCLSYHLYHHIVTCLTVIPSHCLTVMLSRSDCLIHYHSTIMLHVIVANYTALRNHY